MDGVRKYNNSATHLVKFWKKEMRGNYELRNYGIRTKSQELENGKMITDNNRVNKISISNEAGYYQQTNNQQLTTNL